jgi:hypothetical protein
MKELRFKVSGKPIPPHLINDVRGKLAYVDEKIEKAIIAEAGDEIHFLFNSDITAGQAEQIKSKTEKLIATMTGGLFSYKMKVMEDKTCAVPETTDPLPELLKRKEVFQEGMGYFVLGPLLSGLVDFVENEIIGIARSMKARTYRFPALIAPEYLEKVQYFKNFPHSLSFVTHLREDLDSIKQFSEEAHTHQGCVVADSGSFKPCHAMLAPTVCHHLYLTLADSEIPEEGIIATAVGNCFRYESINMVSLERSWNFTIREIICVGSDKQVKENLDLIRGRMSGVLEVMGLSYRIVTANDPFFVDTFKNQVAIQNALEMKYEIRADLPYKNDTLAVGSYNRHGVFFGKILNIRLPDGKPACSSCLGVGLERIAFAFVAQYGVDPQQWPEAVKNAVSGMY